MGLISEIQHDIINSPMLTPALRKAQIMAYQLDNPVFKNWIASELGGYADEDEPFDSFIVRLPNYRKTYAEHVCNVTTGFQIGTAIPVQLPDGLGDAALMFWCVDGIPVLERLLEEEGTVIRERWPDFMVNFVNQYSNDPRMQVIQGWKQVPNTFIVQIIETVKGRLLNFTLELKQTYPTLDEDIDLAQSIVDRHQVSNLVHNYISIAEGASMSIFDQKGQSVMGNQYNAAGDINFDKVQNASDFGNELEKLKNLLALAIHNQELGEDIAVDAEYQLTKAIQHVKKPAPDKVSILTHLTKLKSLVSEVTTMAGFIISLDKAIAVIDKIF